MKDPYQIYLETFGQVKTGKELTRLDYGEQRGDQFTEYDEERKLAVVVAADDAKRGAFMKTKSEFEEEIKRMLGS